MPSFMHDPSYMFNF